MRGPLLRRRPAGPRLSQLVPPVLLGNMMYRPLSFLQQVAQRHEISYLGWAGQPLYFVNEPTLVKDMLCDTERFHKGTILKKLEIIIGKGLITLDGPRWLEARKRVQKTFSRGVLPGQQEIVVRHTQAMVERLDRQLSDVPQDFDLLMIELALNIALELFVGAKVEDPERMRRLHWAMDTCNAYAKWRIWALSSEKSNTKRNVEFREALKVIEDLVSEVIEQRVREVRTGAPPRCDLLSMLLESGFEGKDLRDHVMTLLIAGHETTGTTMSFLWALLARHPNIMETLHTEADAFDESSPDLSPLRLTEAVWRETLRLYPSVPVLDRTAVAPAEIGNYPIPEGANVLWSPYVMHRSQQYWPHRRDLERFDPEAFLNAPPPEPGSYIPFGEGPRMCLGRLLADMTGLVIMSLFLRRFRLEPIAEQTIPMRTLVTLRPSDGVLIRLSRRQRKISSGRTSISGKCLLPVDFGMTQGSGCPYPTAMAEQA